MTFDALYHIGADMAVRAVITDGVETLTHHEVAGTLTAIIPGASKPRPGDMLGFCCVDGRFRLFTLSDTEYEDDTGQVSCTALDAAWQELAETVIPGEKQLLDVTAAQAVTGWTDGTAWKLGKSTAGSKREKLRSYYQDLRTILDSIQQAYGVRALPYYAIDGSRITGRYIDIEPDEGVYRGRLAESGYDADKVSVTYTGVPVTAVYPLGARMGNEETSPRLTIAGVSWSTAAGDPAAKPSGQDWIGDSDALAAYGRDGKHRYATAVFDDIEDAEALIRAGWEYLKTVSAPRMSAAASLYDIDLAQGASHAAIRAGDIIRLRPRHHTGDVEQRIVEIKREYTDAARTVFEIGDRTASAASVVRALNVNAQHTKETLTLYRNKFRYDEQLLAMHAQVISLTSDRVTELVTGQEGMRSQIELLTDEIDLRVTKGSIISAINLSPEKITISADRVDIQGLVTADKINAAIASAGGLYTDRMTAKRSDITTLYATNFFFKNQALGLYDAIQVCTRSALYSVSGTSINYVDWNGNQKSANIVTSVSQEQSPGYRTISYLGYK